MTKMYKGFNKDMTCRGFQFKEGETYETDTAELCRSGFHACESPLDCFTYYDPANSVFHEVELDATDEKHSDDTKRVGKKIKIGARLDVAGICKAHFEYVKEHTANDRQAQDRSSLSAGKNSVLAAFNSKAKAGIGSLIALARREWSINEYKIVDFAAAIVDGEKIKADTWYVCKNGELIEWEEGTDED